ncbi:MAG: putative Ig domain-containing protein [Kiritimatiellia bacterium]
MNRRIFAPVAGVLLGAAWFAASAQAAVVVLHDDDFAYITTGNSTGTGGSGTAWNGGGIYTVDTVYQAGGAVRVGNSKVAGSITTTNLAVQTGTLNVQVDVKGWTNVEGDLLVSVAGQQETIAYTAVMAGTFETVSANFPVTLGDYPVTFATSAKRCFLDNILITQEFPDDMVQLAAPVALPPTATNKTSFTAAWSPVADAQGYRLSVFALTVDGTTTNAVPLAGSPFSVGSATTSHGVTGLTQDSLYRYSIRAVGNGVTLGDSPASNTIVVETLADVVAPIFTVAPEEVPAVQELSPVSFTITATVDGNPVVVTYAGGLPSGASYTFTNGAFSWTPALGDAGDYSLNFTALGGDGLTYTNTVPVTVNALPLTAPQNLAAANVTCSAFDLSWNAVPAATQGYVASVWTGSAATNTPNADVEPFYEIEWSGRVRAPYGWTFSSITAKYATTNYVELKFDGVGDTIITKRHPKPVTSLSFNLRGQDTSSLSNNVVVVHGSADDATWDELETYNTLADDDGDDSNNIFTSGNLEKSLTFAASEGYRRFKFVYAQDEKGNVGIGNIAVVYDGCGTKFIGDWNAKATTSTTASVAGGRPGRDHYALVGASNATETKYSLIGFATDEAPRGTIVVLK